jgi:UDPglucose 6-dehydrogenase
MAGRLDPEGVRRAGMDVSVVGLGKLGSPMAATIAAKGHRVVGVDVNERFVEAVNAGKAPVFEPGLQEMLGRTGGRLTATTDLAHAVRSTDITFVIVPTPTDHTGGFSMKYALAAAQSIGEALKQKDRYHVVVLVSTVMPGCTVAELIPTLERASGKKVPDQVGVCYSPEFIALGTVIRDFLNPDLLLIGESDPKAGQMVADFYLSVYERKPHIARMAPVNAEITKLALNTYVTTKISYANMLARLCEQFDGGDVDQVTTALGADSRIGGKYLKGAIAYGGPCFPRDNVALASLGRRLGVPVDVPVATDAINCGMVGRLKELALAKLPPGGTVGLLGLSYKPGTNVVERGQGFELAQALLADGVSVLIYDPCAMDAARPFLQGPVGYAGSAAECARKADVVLVTIPAPECKALTPADVSRQGNKKVVIDCWRVLDRSAFEAVCDYVGLGTHDVRRLLAPKLMSRGKAA